MPLNKRFLNSIQDLHSGAFFGETGKAIWCISSLSMTLFGISGVMMFYGRNRKKI
ncbi:MAG: PepSY domain-containing protein [Campylobacteraceae bacterium]|nr:PepSY domain-containing protein [Campylobacteraceae bacterium]